MLNLLGIPSSFADVPSPEISHSLWSGHNNFVLGFSVVSIISILLIWMLLRNIQRNKISRKNEKYFKTLLESTAAIPWELDLSTWCFTYVGAQIFEVTGYKAEEWYVDNFWAEHIHPIDKESSLLLCTQATERHEDHELEYRFVKKDGSIIWLRDTVQVVVENDKQVVLRGFMFDITKQKEEQDIREYTEHLLAVTQGLTHIGSWEFNLINNKITWSEETYRIFEIDAAQRNITYEYYISAIHPDDREKMNSVYTKSVENHSGYEVEHRLLFDDGRIKYIKGQGEHQYNDNGEVIRSFGSMQDITERKQKDEAIKKIASTVSSGVGDDFYEELVTNMAEMFDADYAFIGLLDEKNPMLVNTYMVYAHGEIVPNMSYSLKGSPCINVIGKEACVYPEEVQQLFPDDDLLVDMGVDSYIGIPLHANNKKAVGLVVVLDSKPMRNTSQMKELLKIFASRTEAELEKKKSDDTIKKLSLAVEQSPNIIMITDAKGIIEYVNPVFTEITGYSGKDALGETPSLLKSGEMPQSFYDELWKTIRSGKSWAGVFYNKRSNGELYWDEAKISPIKNRSGEITHYLGVQSDITDKKKIEQQVMRSQKMDALGKLTGGIAHDYNNMLNVIQGYTELLEMVVIDEKAIEFLKEIQAATDRGATLTKKLLSFSRQEPTEAENVDVNQLLLDMQNMLNKTLTARINFKYQLTDSVWSTSLDKNDLGDAVLNMCINAMHAMPDGGDLTVTTLNQVLTADEAKLLNIPAGNYIQFSLSDSGCGINKDALNHVFDPFFTTKGDLGTGLGLTQVYGFVKRAKGAITIDSHINEGTNILIYLPQGSVPDTDNIKILTTEVEELTGEELILVVDDEVTIGELSKTILESKGYQVLVANSGEAALSLLKDNKIDLMLSDVIMPNMDGYKLAGKVRNSYPNVKIQLVSGFDDDRRRTEDDEGLAKCLLHKPYKSTELLKAVRKLLDE